MVEEGAFGPERRVELIDGKIVPMSPIGDKENGTVNCLTRLFFNRFRERATIQIRGSVELSDISKVRPDLTILRRDPRCYRAAAPTSSDDVFLIIETFYTTSDDDHRKRLSLYARSGVPEVWQIDLDNDIVSVHRKPEGSKYRMKRIPMPGNEFVCETFPDVSFKVDDDFSFLNVKKDRRRRRI